MGLSAHCCENCTSPGTKSDSESGLTNIGGGGGGGEGGGKAGEALRKQQKLIKGVEDKTRVQLMHALPRSLLDLIL